jgi:hypothetical protein
MCVQNQDRNCEYVHIVMKIYCYSKFEIIMQEFNPHLPVEIVVICAS